MGAGAVDTRDEKDLTQLFEVLDEKSRAILWHLWWYRHAEISELRDVIDADDFEVLHRLKETINGKAQKIFGKPIVGFEQSKIDPVSGKKVLFSWWFLDEGAFPLSSDHKPVVDVFSEKDSVTIIAELPMLVDLTYPDVHFKNGVLKVKLKRKGQAQEEKEQQRR